MPEGVLLIRRGRLRVRGARAASRAMWTERSAAACFQRSGVSQTDVSIFNGSGHLVPTAE